MTDMPQAPPPASGGIVARLGRALYWTAFAIASLLLVLGTWEAITSEYGNGMTDFIVILFIAIPIYGIGRFFRYVLAGE